MLKHVNCSRQMRAKEFLCSANQVQSHWLARFFPRSRPPVMICRACQLLAFPRTVTTALVTFSSAGNCFCVLQEHAQHWYKLSQLSKNKKRTTSLKRSVNRPTGKIRSEGRECLAWRELMFPRISCSRDYVMFKKRAAVFYWSIKTRRPSRMFLYFNKTRAASFF